ncbi:MAG TPA: TIGR03621 family F420-dependent LLM class oxidoreductase [Acidimicrobiia bacterium]|nr:TIGR03621 family F420-dependent LLM class oxidoreductase [Acidimicrobiia bacterium]
MHPFRFGAMVGRAASRSEWLDQVRRAEDLGFSTLFISDHFSDKLAPLPALAMAAEHTSLRIGTLVLANDFRHPAVVAKEAATVDLLSGGRLELGLGTGWSDTDYEASGIERSSPGTQVDRLEEAVRVMRGLWSPEPVDFAGEHYRVFLDGLPDPGPGRPTLLIGGGARRMLGLAGRHADIVGISAGEITRRGELRHKVAHAGEMMDRRMEWVRAEAGERFSDLEVNILTFGVAVGDRRQAAARLAEQWDTGPEAILSSPHFLVGDPDQIAADLVERRERWGINYPVIQAESLADMAPVVAALAGS